MTSDYNQISILYHRTRELVTIYIVTNIYLEFVEFVQRDHYLW